MNLFKSLFKKPEPESKPESDLKKLCEENKQRIIKDGVLIIKEECIKAIERSAKQGLTYSYIIVHNVFNKHDNWHEYRPFDITIAKQACKELQEEYKDISFKFKSDEYADYINMEVL